MSDGGATADILALSPEQRAEIWRELSRLATSRSHGRVAPGVDPAALASAVRAFDFREAVAPQELLAFVVDNLEHGQLDTSHPCYFGVFNPCPTAMGIVGDVLASLYNSQLASYVSSPFGVEVEQHVLAALGERLGLASSEGTFTTGGAESNHTALLVALAQAAPEALRDGVRTLARQPLVYVSEEGHDSIAKAARLCGLGQRAVREIAVDDALRLRPDALADAMTADARAGHFPLAVIATIGTTNAGASDPLDAIATVAEAHGAWLHVDAAWGGAAALLPELSALFEGMSRADSLSLDLHKWMSLPMTAGTFLTRHHGLLEATFRVEHTHYMPPSSMSSEHAHPYARSMQWSRRFVGLKAFLSLGVAGFDGYARVIRHMVARGRQLREGLLRDGWVLHNDTELPVVCFTHPSLNTVADVEAFAREVAETGRAWITTTRLRRMQPVLRAGIANYQTEAVHIDELLCVLRDVRARRG